MDIDIVVERKAGLDKMIQEMAKNNTTEATTGFTQGWDIVVSYSEKDINERLKRKWEQSRKDAKHNMITSIDIFGGTYDDETGDTKWSFRTLELGPPRIEFEGQAVMEPAVHLVHPVDGVYWQHSNEKKEKLGEKRKQLEVANPYNIRLSGIKLGSVTGKYATIKSKSDGQIASVNTLPRIDPSTKTVVFREKPTEEDYENAWVVLDFPLDGKNLNVDVDLNIKPGEPMHDQAYQMKNNIVGAVKSYFKDGPARIDVLEYTLATLKNIPKHNGTVTADLTPVSFRFATYASSYSSATLSIFIHTLSGTDSGVKHDLQVRWMASWTNKGISPIPAGYTASLLINPVFAYNVMFKAGMEKNNDYKLDSLKDDKQGGLSFSGKYQKTWDVGDNKYEYEGKVHTCELEIQGWKKDLKDDPVHFRIYQQNTNSAPVAKLDWDFTVDNKWRDITKNEVAFGQHTLFMEKFMRTDYKLHTERKLDIIVNDSNFSFDINTSDLQTKWEITSQPRDADGSFLDKASNTVNNFISTSPPDDIKKKREDWMKSLKPSIDFQAVGLGFFLTTNLLNPGAKVIKLDQDVLRIPRDIVLVGDVVQGTDIVKDKSG